MFRFVTKTTYGGLSSRLSIHKRTTLSSRFSSNFARLPENQGLYKKDLEKDSCGVGIVAHLKRLSSRQILVDANQMLVRMSHRGGCGCEVNTGDGAGHKKI